jgi:hypothetical protein
MSAPRYVIALAAALILAGPTTALAEEDRAARQAELDRACEAEREKKLAPLRRQFVAECVQDQQFDTREECETFYADYGSATGGRAALFYDLPPCVKAFEYQKSERSGG